MASVDATVRQFITSYPALAKNRTEVLHFALCVLGNDWQWIDGEVISGSSFEPWTPEAEWETIEEKMLAPLRASQDEGMVELMRIFWAERVEAMEDVVATVDERIHQEGTLEFVYPQSQWALLMNMPDDVTDDWRAECEKMREIVARDGGWVF